MLLNMVVSLKLQMAYADFLTFKMDEPDKAITILKNALKQTTSDYQYGDFKLKLGDILVYTNKFNEALINYSQVQTDLKNSSLAQTARFKVAQTSYFKGDFKWALSQLKVLKKSTSQLIANDALELHLLISDNIIGDTLHTALKMYAKADVLAFQNKNQTAIDTLNSVLKKFKGGAIEDEALYKQAQLYSEIKKYDLTGVSPSDAQSLKFNIRLGKPIKKGETYRFLFKLWDKKSDKELKGNIELIVI